MTALRCTQKLLTAMKVKPSTPPVPGASRLGDWPLNLLHTRPKLVVAVSEHDRLGLVLEANLKDYAWQMEWMMADSELNDPRQSRGLIR